MFVAFDFDGTLADTFPIFREAFDEAAVSMELSHYRSAEDERIRSLDGEDLLQFHGIQPQNFAGFEGLVQQAMGKRLAGTQLFDGVANLLANLNAEGHHLGLFSSHPALLVDTALGSLRELFGYRVYDILASDKAGTLREAAASWASSRSLCYVGDQVGDCKAAQAAGVPFLGVCWGYNTEASLSAAGCDFFAHSPRELAHHIDACAARVQGSI